MSIEQKAQPNSNLRVESNGQTIIDFEGLELEKILNHLDEEYPYAKLNHKIFKSSGNGKFIKHDTLLMTYDELEKEFRMQHDMNNHEKDTSLDSIRGWNN